MRFVADHDFHIHSTVSRCCHDENQTPEAILNYAKENGYKKVCLTNHFWDENVKSEAEWIDEHNFSCVSSVLPLPEDKNVDFLFGCETDMDFNNVLGISDERLVSFDPGQDLGMYSPKKLKEVISNVNILFGNHHEIKRIQESMNVDINGLMDLGPEVVLMTCGSKGSIIYSPDEGKIEVESIYRPAVDPTGAGDSYKAGFVSRLIYGASLEEAAKFASSVSSFVVEKQGCQTNMPTYDDAYNRMMDFYK